MPDAIYAAAARKYHIPFQFYAGAGAWRRSSFNPACRLMLIEESEMQKNHTNSKGNVSESAALNAFSKAGFVVSLPFGNGAPYDLIVDTGKRLLKVQVKTGRLRGGCVLFPAQRIYGHHGTKRHKYDDGEIDLFAIYCRENDTVYLVPTLGALAEGRLRVNSTKNNQHQHVRWAKDFEFETFLKSL